MARFLPALIAPALNALGLMSRLNAWLAENSSPLVIAAVAVAGTLVAGLGAAIISVNCRSSETRLVLPPEIGTAIHQLNPDAPVSKVTGGPIDGLLSHAQFLLDQHDPADALKDYDDALSIDSQSAQARWGRGQAHIALSDYSEAEKDLTEYIYVARDECRGYDVRGTLRFNNLNHFVEAAADYGEVIARCPSAVMYLWRGDAYYFADNFGAALEDFSFALSLDKRVAGGLKRRANAYFYLGRHQLAITDYTNVLNETPRDREALVHRGFSHGMVGEFQLAVTDLNAALDLNSGDEAVTKARDTFAEKLK